MHENYNSSNNNANKRMKSLPNALSEWLYKLDLCDWTDEILLLRPDDNQIRFPFLVRQRLSVVVNMPQLKAQGSVRLLLLPLTCSVALLL